MYVFISFYKSVLTDKVRRKQVHMVDNPTAMFELMNSVVSNPAEWQKRSPGRYPEWSFYAYQVDVDPQYVYVLYRGLFNSDSPWWITDNVLSYYFVDTLHHAKVFYCLND